MKTCDVIFFFHVLWSICHPSKSDVVNDPRFPYFTSMKSFTNIYKFRNGIGGSYGNKWKNVAVTYLFRFNGIPVRFGIIGGSNGALYEQWNPNLPMHSPEIAQYMTLTRFCEIKRNIKLCNKDAAKSRDQEG